MKFIQIFIFFIAIGAVLTTRAQKNDPLAFKGSAEKQVLFRAHPFQEFGLDDFYLKSWEERVEVINGKDDFKYIVPVKSISPIKNDLVLVELIGKFDLNAKLRFVIVGDTLALPYQVISESFLQLEIPKRDLNYEIIASYENEIIGKLNVVVYPLIQHTLKIVPIIRDSIDQQELEQTINQLFAGANMRFKLQFETPFQSNAFNDSTIFENPDTTKLKEYTDQMFRLIHAHELVKPVPTVGYKLYVIPQFEDTLIRGFMGIGNRTGFVARGNIQQMAQSIARQLGRGIGYMPSLKNQIPAPEDTLPDFVMSYHDWEQFRSGEANQITWIESKKTKKMGAVAAYYYWEENADGIVIEKSIARPYKRNYYVSVSNPAPKVAPASEKMQYAVRNFMDDNSGSKTKSTFEYKTGKGATEKIQIPLKKEAISELSSIVFRKRNGKWESEKRKNVLYFNIFNDSLRKFSHANDSIILSKYNVAILANGHYLVKTFWKSNGKIAKQEVFAYNGENVTSFFLQKEKMIPKRILVFSNGYRGPDKNNDVSDDIVTSGDRFSYWMGIDKEFIKRIEPFETYYIDGSHGIATSSHKSMLKFGWSIAAVKTFAPKDYYEILNSKPNEAGFNERREKGKIAGKAFLNARCNSPACIETLDTVDIVCHSMGYAYALGFIDAIQGKVIFGKMYIIAPENACVGGTDWSQFEEVWQYGSNLDQPNPDPVWEQDGIAPQCQVKGLEKVPPTKGGRAFIPKDWPTKNFVDSHMLFNYFWMFNRIKKGEPGYIKPRNEKPNTRK